MTARPMMFSTPMVKAIRERRKWMTRRVVNPKMFISLGADPDEPEDVVWQSDPRFAHCAVEYGRCPHGMPGDQLWVKETWGLRSYYDITDWISESVAGWNADDVLERWMVDYRADGEIEGAYWRSAMYMPRWVSRTTLDVTAVRVERLQDISEEDAQAEGVDRDNEPCDHVRYSCAEVKCLGPGYRAAFGELWQSINGKREGCAWKDNPWVWVLSFRLNPQ